MQKRATLSLLLSSFLWFGNLLTAQAQTLDPTFQPTVLKANLGLGAQTAPQLVLTQPDGKVLMAGGFDFANGATAGKIQRLNADGTTDASFNAGGVGANGFIATLVLQSDGKILIGGGFTAFNGVPRLTVARLHTNGTLDASFSPTGITGRSQIGAMALQADGKILVGGSGNFDTGAPGAGLYRLNTDGSLDTSFNTGAGITTSAGFVRTVFLQADGKILVGGTFTNFNGQTVGNMMRLTADGSLDTGFAASADNAVRAFAQQADGRIIVAGAFTTINGLAAPRLARLLANGTVDASFNGGAGPNNIVFSVLTQSNGSIIFGGVFTQVNGTTRNRLARVSANGTLDAAFATGTAANGSVTCLSQIGTGQIMVAGSFSQFDGVVKTGLTRMTATGANDPSFSVLTEARGAISRAVPLANGRLLIAGTFSEFNGTAVTGSTTRRLNADGTLDNTFSTSFTGTPYGVQPDGSFFLLGTAGTRYVLTRVLPSGLSDNTFAATPFGTVPTTGLGAVQNVAAQPDGKLLVYGNFTTYGSAARNGLARLNTNGTLDVSFAPPASTIARIVTSAFALSTGKIIILYQETGSGATVGTKMARLNTDGTLDTGFALGAGATAASSYTALPLPDGKLILSGSFTTFNGQSTPFGLVRLNADGSLDNTFNGVANSYSVPLVQPDGRLVAIAGSLAGTSVVRLTTTGALDNTFNPVSIPVSFFVGEDLLNGLVLQPADGKIIVFGTFRSVGGQPRIGLARLLNPGANSTRTAAAMLPLSVYPNPAQSQLTVKVPTTQGPLQATLRNLQGQSVRSWAVPANRAETTLDVRNLAAGLYLLEMIAASSTYQQKVVITK